MARIRFTKDFGGSVETSHKAYAKGDVATVSDFAAGQLVGSGHAERADAATDPASPLNLAGPDGHPLAQARIPANPAEAGETSAVIAGVEVEHAEAPVEPEESAKGSAKKKGKK